MPKRSAEGPPASEEPVSHHKCRPYEPEREFKQQDAASSSGTSSSVSSSASVLEVDVSKAVVTPDLVRRASMSILSSIGASRSKPLAALSAEEEQDLRRFYLHLMRGGQASHSAPHCPHCSGQLGLITGFLQLALGARCCHNLARA